MDPDRWRRIEELCHAAAARPAGERAASLAAACGDDVDLRREVESLLAEESRAEDFLLTGEDGPAFARRHPSIGELRRGLAKAEREDAMIGSLLGPYRVLEKLGEGGMGEVYKARDTRLDRIVALKILPPEVSGDPERHARFAREAKTISQLNHPHICTLYDVGEAPAPAAVGAGVVSEGVAAGFSRPVLQYLVMEFLDGETLTRRLDRGPIPLQDALRIGAELADGLAAAHKLGVVHRDLKPGNVMLVRSGTSSAPAVKLLDFGLARHARASMAQGFSLTDASVRTLSDSLTDEGRILGTLPYMAPEQLEGKPADARTDLWALGTIVYEMLTGKRAFEGDTSAALIGAILEREPEALAARQPLTSPALHRLVRKCLAKAPDDRWDSAHDVADELRWIRETSGVQASAGALAPEGRRRRGLRLAGLAGAALVLVAINVVMTWMVARLARTPPAPVQRLLIDTRPADSLGAGGAERMFNYNRPSRTAIALSPDGAFLVFSAVQGERRQLYVRKLAGSAALPLEGTEGAECPFFSPDGVWVGFWARGALWKMRLDGGAPIQLCPTKRIEGASWSSKGLIAFGRGAGEIVAISADGGTTKAISTVDRGHGERWHGTPHFLPDGETLLFTAFKSGVDPRRVSVAAVSLATGARLTLVEGAADARYVPTGHLVYVRLGQLEAASFDPVRVAVTGGAVGLIPDVAQALNAASGLVVTGAAQLTISASGTLVYVAGGMAPDRRNELVWVDRHGTIVETLGIPRGPIWEPRLSPDGRRIVYLTTGANGSLWCYDLARRTSTMIPTTDPEPWYPMWLPDGRRVMFMDSSGRLRIVPVDGSAPSTPVGGEVPGMASEVTGTWTPDGKTLIFTRQPGDGSSAIWQLRLDGGSPQRSVLLEPPAAAKQEQRSLAWPAISPDGRWLAYVSAESGGNQVYILRYPALSGRQQLSRDGGRELVWRPDGRELFYGVLAPPRRMMAIDIRPGPDLQAGLPRELFQLSDDLYIGTTSIPSYDVALDGQRFLFVRRFTEPVPPPPSQMHIVLNWFEELKAKVPVR